MKTTVTIAASNLCLSVAGAADARKYTYQDVDHAMTLHYGFVSNIEQADMSATSGAGTGAMIGGMSGLAYARHRDKHRTKTAAEAAIAGALIGSLINRHRNKAKFYTVNLVDVGTIRVIHDDADLRTGDCVSVEDGRYTNIRRVSDSYCQPSDEPDYLMVHHSRAESSRCSLAKDELLDARDEEQLAAAERKVRVLCH